MIPLALIAAFALGASLGFIGAGLMSGGVILRQAAELANLRHRLRVIRVSLAASDAPPPAASAPHAPVTEAGAGILREVS